MTWHEGLTLLALALTVVPLCWIVFVRRELFDPRVYVLGGLLHWLLVSQFITTFGIAERYFEFDPYEANYGFSDASYLKIDLLIVASVVAFLLGYAVLPREARQPAPPSDRVLLPRKLAAWACAAGYLGFFAFRLFEIDPTLPVEAALLLSYLMPASSVLASYLLLSKFDLNNEGSRLSLFAKAFLAFLPAVTIVRTNMALIYPLCAMLFFSVNRFGRLNLRAPSGLIACLPAFGVGAILTQACVKAYNVLAFVMDMPLFDLLRSDQYWENIRRALMTFDIFNAESYSLLVHMYELYVEPARFKWGVTLLAAFPVTKLLWRDEIKGLGRRFILDVNGVDARWETALAVSPVGEMMVNFTFVGVIAFYFVLGLGCAYLYRRVKEGTSLTTFVLYPVFLTWFFVQQRGDFLNGNMYSVYILLVGAVLLRWSMRPAQLVLTAPKPGVRLA